MARETIPMVGTSLIQCSVASILPLVSHVFSPLSARPPSRPLAMSIAQHFPQQRKVVAPTASLKVQPQPQPTTKNVTPTTTIAPFTPSTTASSAVPSIAALAKEARLHTIGWESESDEEVLLRKFDLQLAYGPMTGISRAQRWERAAAFGLNPPAYLWEILLAQGLTTSSDASKDGKPYLTQGGVSSHSFIQTRV